jgi:hypothetical protein
LSLEGSATVTMWIHYCAFSCLTDELDDMIQWTVTRFDTADGTGDALTPTPLHDADIAAQGTFLGNHTAEPTYVATEILLDIAVNTRSFQQWYAQPGRELMTAAGANEGIGIAPLHASSTPTALCTVHFIQ